MEDLQVRYDRILKFIDEEIKDLSNEDHAELIESIAEDMDSRLLAMEDDDDIAYVEEDSSDIDDDIEDEDYDEDYETEDDVTDY
jgi:hypothetical protein